MRNAHKRVLRHITREQVVEKRALQTFPKLSTPNAVKIVEVGPRDGLQNEPDIVSVEDKVTLITKLADAGCSYIETGSFVSPKWVPTMANSVQVMRSLEEWKKSGNNYKQSPVFSCLVPNLKGFEQALDTKSDEIAIFGSASEAFSQKVSFHTRFYCTHSSSGF